MAKAPKQTGIELVVVSAFLGYSRGDVISDPEKITEILASGWELHVVKRQAEPAAS